MYDLKHFYFFQFLYKMAKGLMLANLMLASGTEFAGEGEYFLYPHLIAHPHPRVG